MKIKWTHLTKEQKEQVLDFYSDEMRNKQMFGHCLNKRSFSVNICGNIVFSKDF